jgi:hypothetical protein
MQDIGELLPAIFKSQFRRGGSFLVEILSPFWARVAGKPIAQHCCPVAFEAGTLTLATNCPAWASELGRLAEEIRAKINTFLGEPIVKKLRIRYEPNLGPLSTGNLKSDSPSFEIGARQDDPFRLSNLELRTSDREARFDLEVARVVERSLTKYFSRHSRGVR